MTSWPSAVALRGDVPGMQILYVSLVVLGFNVVCCQRVTVGEADQEDQLLSAAMCDEKESGTASCVSRGWRLKRKKKEESFGGSVCSLIDLAFVTSTMMRLFARGRVVWCTIKRARQGSGHGDDRQIETRNTRREKDGERGVGPNDVPGVTKKPVRRRKGYAKEWQLTK